MLAPRFDRSLVDDCSKQNEVPQRRLRAGYSKPPGCLCL